jgi:cell wall assembly regulator SMI1
VSDAAPEAAIKAAEQVLGVLFPADYRSFLAHCGWAQLGHNCLHGLNKTSSRHESVMQTTQFERASWQQQVAELSEEFDDVPEFSHGYVTLMADGRGGCFCLDTVRTIDRRCPLIWWDHELLEANEVAGTFEEWVQGMLKDKDMSPLFKWARPRR